MADREETKTRPPITVERSPVVNFIAAIDAAGPRKDTSDEAKHKKDVYRWREITRRTVSAFDMADLDLVFEPLTTTICLFNLAIREDLDQVPELIDHITTLSTESFIDGFRRVLNIDVSDDDWIDADGIEQALELDRDRETTSFRREAEQLERLLAAGETFRLKTVQILTWFHERVFASEENMIMEQVARWIKKHEARVALDPKFFMDLVFNDIYDTVLSGATAIRLFPIADNTSSDRWLMIPDEAYSVFGIDYADGLVPADGETRAHEDRTDELIVALADPKRVAILRLLRTRPHFGREIADELGISASTTSYHIERLVAAHLIRLDLSRGRRFYYAINTKGFLDFLRRVQVEFIGEVVDGSTRDRNRSQPLQ